MRNKKGYSQLTSVMFDKRFIAPILEGRKTVTRRPRKKSHITEGSTVTLMWNYSKDGIFAKAKILSCERGKFGDIDEREARREGFSSLAELKAYFGGGFSASKRIWAIRFTVTKQIGRRTT